MSSLIHAAIAALRTREMRLDIFHPSSITVTAGTVVAGVVADVAIIGGNFYQIEELSSTPGFDFTFEFTNIVGIPRHAHVLSYYNGNHSPQIQAYDYVGAAWLTLETIIDSGGAQNFHSYFLPLDSRCVSGGVMRLRFNHAANGSNTHDQYVDYVAVTAWRE